MEQLLTSYARVNRAKQWNDRQFQGSHLLGQWHQREPPDVLRPATDIGVRIEDCTKVATPYGMSISWELHSVLENKRGMYVTVHLKDNRKVKNKKRQSQIMYMSYVLDYITKKDSRGKLS
ncbi:hypothetical protein LSH36_145g07008 [Paralvinella palmiformis]|uniref:Uncharacterized protein n=1 Tax=Paralvinella palmiformis TaxID=53620 RepID=A0AAD9N7C8_9ANNE|nr:hypothetical protein LSH36_145g07008 [Paralvinella palmiformis]